MTEVAIKSAMQIAGASPSARVVHRVSEWRVVAAICEAKEDCASECNRISKTRFTKAYKKKRYNELYEARDKRIAELRSML